MRRGAISALTCRKSSDAFCRVSATLPASPARPFVALFQLDSVNDAEDASFVEEAGMILRTRRVCDHAAAMSSLDVFNPSRRLRIIHRFVTRVLLQGAAPGCY